MPVSHVGRKVDVFGLMRHATLGSFTCGTRLRFLLVLPVFSPDLFFVFFSAAAGLREKRRVFGSGAVLLRETADGVGFFARGGVGFFARDGRAGDAGLNMSGACAGGEANGVGCWMAWESMARSSLISLARSDGDAPPSSVSPLARAARALFRALFCGGRGVAPSTEL